MHPIACLACVYDDGQVLVVEHNTNLAKKPISLRSLPLASTLYDNVVLRFFNRSLSLLRLSSTSHHDEQFPCPIGIELAAEVLVGIERHIVLKMAFRKFRNVLLPVLRSFGHQQ